MDEYVDGFYNLYLPGEESPVLVHCYYSKDCGCRVFGFNTHDGSGLLPVRDLHDNSKAIKVNIVEE